MSKCPKCGNDVKEGQKFCMKCGTPLNIQPQKNVSEESSVACPKCGNPIKPGQKFCMKCGTPLIVKTHSQSPVDQAQPSQKGWFTDGVRAVANAVTGGAMNRDIEREQQQAVRQQARQDQGQIDEALQGQHAAERAQHSAELDAERARERRNQEVIDGIDVVRGKAIWNIQPGQIARRVTETEFNEIEQMKGVIIQEGCTALVYIDGELISTLTGGAYTFPVKSEAELKAEREQAEQQVRRENQQQRGIMNIGVVGYIGIAASTVRRFFLGKKKDESDQKHQTRQEKVERALKAKNQPKLIRVYLVSDRILTLTFGGQLNSSGGIDFVPFKIPTKLVDVEIGVSLQMQISNINDFLRNYLADSDSVTVNHIQQLVAPTVQTVVGQMLRNLDYQQDGLPEPIVTNLKGRVQQAINDQVFGIQCIKVLQVTDNSADFDRFRSVERELFCSEKELGFLQRTGEFRNRLAQETNKQAIDKATNEEELRYALQLLNKDQLLHDDELEQFTLMLDAQKRLREAKSQEEEYEALIDIKKSRLVKDDEMAVLEDAIAHKKIERDSLTELMRIQHQQNIDDAQLKAQWALDDQKDDHDWEREELQRRRNWGIEDEEREREWMHEEQEFNRQFGRTQQQDDYEWQKRIREDDHDWQLQERQREADWQQRQREEQMRREQEQIEYARQRQDKFDDIDILDKKANIAMRNMQAMKDAELREIQEQNRSAENIHGMDVQVTINRDNLEANMTAEQLMAKRAAELSGEGQVAFAQALGSGKENELLQKQQQEQKELYEKMMQMQQAQGSQSQEMMMKMAQMMQQGMIGIGQQQQFFQQQRYEDQRQRADEYRQDAQRQQDRMDHTLDQSLNYTTRAHQTDSQSFAQAMGGVPQGTLHQTQYQKTAPQQSYDTSMPQQPQPSAESVTPQVRHCPACGAEVPEGEMFCGECGNRM